MMTNPKSFFFEDLLSSEDVRPLEGGRLRILTGRAALRQLWHHQTQLSITRLSDLTDLDVLGIPVFGAVRPTVDGAQITATQGKGLTKIDAVVSALFEALERAAAARERPRVKASRNELIRGQRPFIDMPEVVQFPDRELEWCDAISMRTRSSILVAAADTTFPYYSPPTLWRPVRPTTTGFAAGSSLAEAVLHALLEVIERDAVSAFVLGALAKRVQVERLSGVEGELVQRFLDGGAELLMFDLTDLAIVPTYFVMSRGPHDLGLLPFMPMAGQGTHPSSRMALTRALLEAAQSRAVAIQGSREDLVRHAGDWRDDNRALEAEWEEMSRIPSEAISLGMGENLFSTIAEALLYVWKTLEMRGVADVAISVLPVPVENLFAVHVVVPTLVDRLSDPHRISSAVEPVRQPRS